MLEPDDEWSPELMTGAIKQPVFLFTGRLYSQDGRMVARCDHAPLVSSGDNEDEALAQMSRMIVVYLGGLAQRGELDAAIEAGKVHITVADAPALSQSSDWAQPSLERVDGGFRARVPAVDAA
jgi:hypothetical protein